MSVPSAGPHGSAYFESYFRLIVDGLHTIDTRELDKVAGLLRSTSAAGRKIAVAGTGGSAAIASHVAVDLTKAARIRAISFNEADLITCFANDYGYEEWVARALAAYADGGDAVILIGSSGMSKNIVNAATHAKRLGLRVVTLSGFSPTNALRTAGDINLWVNSSEYNSVEMVHHIWLIAVVDRIAHDMMSTV